MKGSSRKLTAAVEDYFAGLKRIRAAGSATGERSSYGPLAGLLDAVGALLRPKVFCIQELADQGAGHPDFGLYAGRQVQKGRARAGQLPERGVVEVKPPEEETSVTAVSDQVARYRTRYGLVLVTNTRDFVLVGQGEAGGHAKLESFSLGETDEFERRLDRPRAFARDVATGLGEYLLRVLSHRSVLTDPGDVAWLLASYARDSLKRVEAKGEAPSLKGLRKALESGLGVRFEGAKGTAFFRSTLVQTLFYGVFSAWVLWARQSPAPTGRFNWHEAVWHLRAPVLRALFQQVSDPGRLYPLGLVEVLDWTAAALNRVDRAAFLSRFDEGEAVPYFYEPFLAAFDPDLRKQLGVWYTPVEVVRYMVARVDKALKDDLGIRDGLAGENVYVLDPCCGTGAYLAEVLRRIADNLEGKELGALAGARLRRAATQRVFGFEIMPAPFVVAHLQVGLTMEALDASLADDGEERAGIFLTNALTGWEPTDKEKQAVVFPELEEERDRAERVKREKPILVVLGNPPYDGFAGVAVDEEQELLDAYRTSKKVDMPDVRGLHDPYVRFFRVAERRIAEKSMRGVVCFISNQSWLHHRSFAGMRERYLNAFNAIRIDNLHGDRIISEYTPDGKASETVFAVRGQSVGIKVGTSIALLSRSDSDSADTAAATSIRYRDFHQAGADERRRALLNSLDEPDIDAGYELLRPDVRLGLPFKPMAVSEDWFNWPAIPDLFPASFSGVNTNRDAFVIDTDLQGLKARIATYFDPDVDDAQIGELYPTAMGVRARFEPKLTRQTLLARGGPDDTGFIRHTYRPFDNRWLYWESQTKLLNEKRPEYRTHVFEGNLWLSAAPHLRKGEREPQACVTRHMASLHLIERGASMFPAWLRGEGILEALDGGRRANLSPSANRYLERVGLGVEDLFHHVVAVLHDPRYLEANAGALSMEWPRVPLPSWPDGRAHGVVTTLAESAARGRLLSALLDCETGVPGVTEGTLRPEMGAMGVPARVDGRNLAGDDFEVLVGWGRIGRGGAVIPGPGKLAEREYSSSERSAMGPVLPALGERTLDIYLNDKAFWRNVPAPVWEYRLGGYQVLKKWLSYREQSVLSRALWPEEIQHFSETVRRIGAILTATRAL